jgi:multicomponent K+:H+ antiporter subunit A
VVGGELPEYSLAIWHGFNAPLMMSLVALAGGWRCYVPRRRFQLQALREHAAHDRPRRQAPSTHVLALASTPAGNPAPHQQRQPAGASAVDVRRAGGAAHWPPRWWCRTSLGRSAAGAGHHPRSCCSGWWAAPRLARPGRPSTTGCAALMLLGVAGIVVCITFAWFSAPDLALTQLAVEAVTMVLFLLGLRWLPKRIVAEEPRAGVARAAWRRGRDLVLAAARRRRLAALSYACSRAPAFAEHLALLPGTRLARRRRHATW